MNNRGVWQKIIITLYLGMTCLLSGCWDRVEINDLALLLGAALDQGEDGLIELSIQIFIPSPSSSEGGGGGKANPGETLVRSAKGVTIADAMDELQDKLSRKIFWGQNEVIIIDQQVAEAGIREHMDFLLRDSKPRERSYLFVASGKAKDILKLQPPVERNSSEVLREMAKMKICISMTMKDFAESLISQKGTAVLPLVGILPPTDKKTPNKTVGYVKGSAIFKHYRMIGRMDDKPTKALQSITNDNKYALYNVPFENKTGYISFAQLNAKTTLHPSIQGDKWRMTIDMNADFDVNQNTSDVNLLDPNTSIRNIEVELEKYIILFYKTAVKDAQQRLKTDVLGYGQAYHKKYPKQWKAEKSRWEERFPQVETMITAHVNVRRPGMSNINSILLKGDN